MKKKKVKPRVNGVLSEHVKCNKLKKKKLKKKHATNIKRLSLLYQMTSKKSTITENIKIPSTVKKREESQYHKHLFL